MTSRPLEGVLVADFSRVLAGPLCTQMLADEGARVIKVEDPRGGDETRTWGPPFHNGVSTYFLSINRGKESVALDLKKDSELARALIVRADVVIDNFLPRQRDELLGDVLSINARAVHCSIGGFDSDTAEAGTPGYDLLAQAASGLMAITGEPDGEPVKSGVAVVDVLTAHYAHGAILAALYAREKSGRGARVEVSLFGAAIASQINVAQAALATGRHPKRYGNAHASIVPYQVFHGSDRAFAIGGGNDRHFRQLCERVIERPELAQQYATNQQRVEQRDVLVPQLDAIFRTRPAAEWVERLRAASIPCALVQDVLEAMRSEPGQRMVGTIADYEAVRHPVRFDGQRLPLGATPPALGQDTERILRELSDPAETPDRRG